MNTERVNNLVCNCCGRPRKMKQDIPMEDFLEVRKNWGYFSKKDGKSDCIVLCEECYDKWIQTFSIPVERTDTTEFM